MFLENQGQFDFDPEKFDFCIHRKKKNYGQKLKQPITMEVPKKIKTLLPKTKTAVTEDSLLVSASTPVTTLVSTSTTSITDGGKISYSIFYLYNFPMILLNSLPLHAYLHQE